MNVRMSRNKTSKRSFLRKFAVVTHSILFPQPFFQLLFELEKKSSLVTRALSTKSCTRDVDNLYSCTRLTPHARMACLYHSCKIWQRKHSYPNLIPIIFAYYHLHLTSFSLCHWFKQYSVGETGAGSNTGWL